jgi:hypothetical protein
MNKPLLWFGAALFALGASAFVLYVLPYIGGAGAAATINGPVRTGPPVLAVAIASFGMAAGAAMFGIGLGRWKRPQPSPHDGSPEA